MNPYHNWRSLKGVIASQSGDTVQFVQEYLCDPWTPSSEEVALQKLAEKYHAVTESFDRTHCSGTYRGQAMAANRLEWLAITKHAAHVNATCERRAMDLGFTTKQWADARHAAAKRHSK